MTRRRTALPRPLLPALAAALLLSVTACTRAPGGAPQESAASDLAYLDLVPTASLVARPDEMAQVSTEAEDALTSRAALLRRRAEALRARDFDV